jgi:hypothetical protein
LGDKKLNKFLIAERPTIAIWLMLEGIMIGDKMLEIVIFPDILDET